MKGKPYRLRAAESFRLKVAFPGVLVYAVVRAELRCGCGAKLRARGNWLVCSVKCGKLGITKAEAREILVED